MGTQILIVWPRAAEAGQLHDAVLRSGLGLSPRVIDHYPDRSQLAGIVSGGEGLRAIIVGMSVQERALQVLKDLSADAPHILAIAAHASESSELLRAVMRAGASDFLTPPFPPADIRRALEAIAVQPDVRPEGMLIAVMPCRGTDGASTVAVHVAQGLSRALGRPPLLIDCDIQCGMTAFRLGVQTKYTLADALANVDRLEDFLEKIVVRWCGFDLISAPESALGLLDDYMQRLPQALAMARRCYPAVIADLPPGIYAAGLEVMLGADVIHLVCTPAITSLHLARRRLTELLDSGVDKQRLRIILNRAGSRNGVDKSDVERVIGMAVHHELANDYSAANQATVEGGLVSADSRLGRDLEALSAGIAGLEPASSARPQPAGWKRILGFS